MTHASRTTIGHVPSAAVVDFGGVLTKPMGRQFKRFAADHGLTSAQGRAVIGALYAGGPGGDGLIQRLERGAATTEDLGLALAAELSAMTGRTVPPEGLFDEIWSSLALEPVMVEAIRRLRATGVRTAMLSNSWGAENYPFDALDGLFDLMVISGREGIRKPDMAIYELTLDRLSASGSACVFIDDLAANVTVAESLGMHGVHHTDPAATVAQLEPLFAQPAGSLSSS